MWIGNANSCIVVHECHLLSISLSRLFAKSALAAIELDDRVVEIVLRHFGPQLVDEDQLRVRDLEQQKVADAHFPRRAEQDVGIR